MRRRVKKWLTESLKNRVQNDWLYQLPLLAEKMADRRKSLRRGLATDYFGQKSDILNSEFFSPTPTRNFHEK